MSVQQANDKARENGPYSYQRETRIDAAALMKLKSLELRAKAVVEGFLSGLHRSPYHGFSAEFSEYRQYTPGDDLRYLDWRLFARSDRYYIKRFEDETNLACWMLLDLSRSMGFGSLDYSKADYARTAAATLAYFLTQQRDAVGLMTFDETVGESLPARYRPGHLHRLIIALEEVVRGESTSLLQPLEQIANTVTKRGLVVLFSDLLAPVDGLNTNLGFLRARGHEVVVVRVLDPQEVDFQFDRASMFRDAETGREFYVDPEAARATYTKRFAEHADQLTQITQNLGVELLTLRTDQPLDDMLFEFLAMRMQQAGGGAASRAGGSR